jgi:hypothetical protein
VLRFVWVLVGFSLFFLFSSVFCFDGANINFFDADGEKRVMHIPSGEGSFGGFVASGCEGVTVDAVPLERAVFSIPFVVSVLFEGERTNMSFFVEDELVLVGFEVRGGVVRSIRCGGFSDYSLDLSFKRGVLEEVLSSRNVVGAFFDAQKRGGVVISSRGFVSSIKAGALGVLFWVGGLFS